MRIHGTKPADLPELYDRMLEQGFTADELTVTWAIEYPMEAFRRVAGFPGTGPITLAEGLAEAARMAE